MQTHNDNPSKLINSAVRTMATFKPKFNPTDGKVFSDELTVLGTAFWLKDYNTLVICSRVIKDIASLPLELAGLLVVGKLGQNQRATISHIDYQHDLAILTLVDPSTSIPLNTEIIKNEAAGGLELCDSYPETGSPVAWSGYPLGNLLLNQIHEPTYSEGIIGVQKRDEGNRRCVQISGTAVGGYSGSPVIDKQTNRVIGVVANGPQNSGIFMAVSFEHVKAIAELAQS